MPRARPKGPQLQRRRGLWYIVYWEGDARRRISTGTANDTRARQALADFETAAESHPLRLSLDEALDRYVESRREKVSAWKRLKEAAVALKIGLGQLRIDQVTQSRWDGYMAGRMTRPRRTETKHVPRPVSTGTLRREYNVLRATLRMCWKAGLLPKPPALEAPRDSAPRDRYLSKDEARRLIAAAVTPHVKVFAALAIFTGARKGSILALTWDRVNFVTGMIDFQEPGRHLTKKRRAIVPMTTQLRAILEEAWKAAQISEPDRVRERTVVEYGGQAVPFGLRWSFGRLCKRAGLDWQPTPHHIKHSVASWLAMDKVPIDQAADWLATDPATLRRTYRKFDPAYLRSVAGALDL